MFCCWFTKPSNLEEFRVSPSLLHSSQKIKGDDVKGITLLFVGGGGEGKRGRPMWAMTMQDSQLIINQRQEITNRYSAEISLPCNAKNIAHTENFERRSFRTQIILNRDYCPHWKLFKNSWFFGFDISIFLFFAWRLTSDITFLLTL